MVKIRCKLDYHRLVGDKFKTFAIKVRDGIYGRPDKFVTPPMGMAMYQAKITAFVDVYAAFQDHTANQSDVDDARTLLMADLDIFSPYVDVVANGDAVIIGLSGFDATKGSSSPKVAPVKPSGVEFNRTGTGELTSDCPVVAGAEYYGAIVTVNEQAPADLVITAAGQIMVTGSTGGALPGALTTETLRGIIDLTKPRRKTFLNLQPGVTYWVYYYAGNAKGVSPLSDGVSILLW